MSATVTGRREFIGDDQFFEVVSGGESYWLPVDPEKIYGRTGEWRGWCDFLGNDNIEEVCQGMTPEERAREIDHVQRNQGTDCF